MTPEPLLRSSCGSDVALWSSSSGVGYPVTKIWTTLGLTLAASSCRERERSASGGAGAAVWAEATGVQHKHSRIKKRRRSTIIEVDRSTLTRSAPGIAARIPDPGSRIPDPGLSCLDTALKIH